MQNKTKDIIKDITFNSNKIAKQAYNKTKRFQTYIKEPYTLTKSFIKESSPEYRRHIEQVYTQYYAIQKQLQEIYYANYVYAQTKTKTNKPKLTSPKEEYISDTHISELNPEINQTLQQHDQELQEFESRNNKHIQPGTLQQLYNTNFPYEHTPYDPEEEELLQELNNQE